MSPSHQAIRAENEGTVVGKKQLQQENPVVVEEMPNMLRCLTSVMLGDRHLLVRRAGGGERMQVAKKEIKNA